LRPSAQCIRRELPRREQLHRRHRRRPRCRIDHRRDAGGARARARRQVGRRARADRRASGAVAHGRQRCARTAGAHSRHRLPRPGHAFPPRQRGGAVAFVSAERARERLSDRRRGSLRMGFRQRRRAGRARRMRSAWRWFLLAPTLALLLVFFVVPVVYLFWVSLHAGSTSELYGASLTLRNYTALVGDSFYLTIIGRTLAIAAVILGLCLVIGYRVAYFVAMLPPRRRMLATVGLLFPLMVSNVVRAYGWVALLERRGVVNTTLHDLGLLDAPLALLYTPSAVVVALMTILLPYMVISIANTLAGLDRRYLEAAKALGASPVRTFLHVTLPLSTPGIASGTLLVFLLTLSAYVTVTLLGGPQAKMLVSLVYDGVVAFQWPRAAALAFVLLAVALAAAALIQ